MAWKKDLQKLKATLGAEDPAPAKPAPPPREKPKEFKSFEEEDAVFLSAMGHRPARAKAPAEVPAAAPSPKEAAPRTEPPVAPPPPPPGDREAFASAMGELKGLKALPQRVPAAKPAPKPAAPVPAAPVQAAPMPAAPVQAAPMPAAPVPAAPLQAAPMQAAPESAAVQAAPEPDPAPGREVHPPLPVQINLAAGMAIDVDGALDLKGHGRADAEERLKERILDGQALGWRTLHVVLGTDGELRDMLMDLLRGPAGTRVARYAQAPIPMGGSQAWILYFRGPGSSAEGA